MLEYQDLFAGLQKKKNDLTYKSVSLVDPLYFDIVSKRNLAKTLPDLLKLRKGDVPVYSAARIPVCAIKELSHLPIFASETDPVISFASNGDGSAGRNFIIHTQPFYIKAERIALRPKRKDIVLPFVLSQIFDIKRKYKYSRTFLANKQNLKIVTINFPQNKDGSFCVDEQKAIASQFEMVTQLRSEITNKYEQLCNITVDIDTSNYSMVYKPLSDVLDPVKGKSKYTRKYGETHKGDYPVFSASSSAPLTYIDTFDYDGDYLSWSTNGFAGTVIVLKGRFSINGDRGLLIPKIDNIDLLYLRYVLEPIFRELAKGRKGDRGEDEFTKLYPSMIADVDIPLPVDENGVISLTAQKEIAAMYDTVEQYRHEILVKLDALLNQRIEY